MHLAAKQLFGGPSQQLLRRPVHGGDAAFAVDGVEAFAHITDDRFLEFQCTSQLLSVFERRPFRPLLFTDVAPNFRCANHAAMRIDDRRYRERNRHITPVFSTPDGFERLNRLPAPYPIQDPRFFVPSIRRTDTTDEPPNNFSAGIAK